MKKILFLFLFIFLNLTGCDQRKEASSSSDEYSTEKKIENSNTNLKTIFEGSNEAKIHLIVYESLTCVHCANFHKEIYPSLKKEFVDTGIIKIEFKSFPLDMASLNASKISHCKNDGKSEILHFLFKNQEKWAKGNTIEEFNKNLKTIIDDQKFEIDFDKCLNDKKIEDFVLEGRINGVKEFNVNATPTIIINNKKFDKTLNYKNLKKTIEKLI